VPDRANGYKDVEFVSHDQKTVLSIMLPKEVHSDDWQKMFEDGAIWTLYIDGKAYELTGAQIANFAKKEGKEKE
jgi:hypothetical protein